MREEPGVAGVHVMAYRQSRYVAEIVSESGVLRGRAPWRRSFVPNMQLVESLEAGGAAAEFVASSGPPYGRSR